MKKLLTYAASLIVLFSGSSIYAQSVGWVLIAPPIVTKVIRADEWKSQLYGSQAECHQAIAQKKPQDYYLCTSSVAGIPLGGWRLMGPYFAHIDMTAPVQMWEQVLVFNTATECDDFRTDFFSSFKKKWQQSVDLLQGEMMRCIPAELYYGEK